MSYCLCCGSPGHTITECNPNYSQLKNAIHDKEDGNNTTRSSTKSCKQWSPYAKGDSIVSSSTSSVDLNKNITKKSFKFKKQNDTSLHQVALLLPKRNLKNNCQHINSKIQ